MNIGHLLILVPKVSPRLKYVTRFIFEEVLGTDYTLSTEKDLFTSYQGPKLHYGQYPIGDELFISCRQLLFETGIKDQDIHFSEFKGVKVFFPTNRFSALPFDPFSAVFYMISRYEEYLPAIRDRHDRFEAGESIAFQNGFLGKPVADIYSFWIKDLLSNRYPAIKWKENKFKLFSTIDIDNAFAYKGKGIMRTGGAMLRSLFSGRFQEMFQRTKVLAGMEQDPYDSFKLQEIIEKKYGINVMYFFLLADYGPNDKNVSIYNNSFRKLIKSLADGHLVGIHPSYGSNFKKEKLSVEIERLSSLLHTDVLHSRQHFLKIRFPDTYKNLIDLNIENDYTMGFASEPGFRAGTSRSFLFFDLDTEFETKLRIHPFQVMDSTLCLYQKIQPEDAVKRVKNIIDETKKVGGTFTMLWHNESLSNMKPWVGWQNVYEEIIIEALKTDL
jgi:hypothetical protein